MKNRAIGIEEKLKQPLTLSLMDRARKDSISLSDIPGIAEELDVSEAVVKRRLHLLVHIGKLVENNLDEGSKEYRLPSNTKYQPQYPEVCYWR